MKTPVLESLFNHHYLKETPAHVFSFEYCRDFGNSFFHSKHLVAGSEVPVDISCKQSIPYWMIIQYAHIQ